MIIRRFLIPLLTCWAMFVGFVPLSVGQTVQPAIVSPAFPEQAVQQAPVFAFLQGYFSALAQGDINKIALYHPALTPQQLGTLHDYFAHTVRDLHIDLRNVQVQIGANTATVAFLRTDRFTDRLTGRQIEKSIQLSTVVEYGTNGWRIGGLDFVAFALGDHTSQAG